jgi:DNA-directed RNA polymerase specialized sigma24 family protein
VNYTNRFLEAVGPHRAVITSTCRRLLWTEQDLEDALQECLTVAYREFAGGIAERPPRELRAWILRIATWTCFNLSPAGGGFWVLSAATGSNTSSSSRCMGG